MAKRSEPRRESDSMSDAKLLLRIASGEVDVHELAADRDDARKAEKLHRGLGKLFGRC